jgi:hypothetical protein
MIIGSSRSRDLRAQPFFRAPGDCNDLALGLELALSTAECYLNRTQQSNRGFLIFRVSASCANSGAIRLDRQLDNRGANSPGAASVGSGLHCYVRARNLMPAITNCLPP